MIGDIEKELDSILDRYQKKKQKTRNQESIDQQSYVAENEFKDSFNTIVRPSMTETARYLDTRGKEFKGSYVKISPHLAIIARLLLKPIDCSKEVNGPKLNFPVMATS